MTNWLAICNVKICINENNRQGCFLDIPFHVGDLKISVFINPLCVNQSHVLLFATPWTVAHQALLSMGFSRQEYWSG